MISAKEALDSPRVRLSERELSIFQMAEARISAGIRDNFTGHPFNITLPISDVPARVVFALQRRFAKPATDGSRWIVNVLAINAVPENGGEREVVGYQMTFEPAPPADFVVKKPEDEKAQKSILRTLFDELASMHGFDPGATTATTLSATPTLSIIFGTYNRISHLKRAVESVRKSVGGLSYEFCICDGGSTDGSREWLAAQRDVIFIGERHLEGAVKAFNQAFRASRGQFVANLNDDCTVVGNALPEGVKYLQDHPDVGQVAFGFNLVEGTHGVNSVYPRKTYPTVTWPTTYANFGITRRSAAEQVAAITGGFWAPVYKTYAGDCELSAWMHKLGWKIAELPHLHVVDDRPEDPLRERNSKDSGLEAKRMYVRWPAEAFRPDGPDPRVTPEELERFHRVRDGLPVVDGAKSVKPPEGPETFAQMVGWPEPQEEERLQKIARRIRALDPVEGKFPERAAALRPERVLHVALVTKADPQAGLVRALKKLGSAGYAQVDWYDLKHDERQIRILDEAAKLRPSVIFMQLQEPNAVDVDTMKALRQVCDPSCVIATWCGDIASFNSPWNVDQQVAFGRTVDLVLHSSYSHVSALRAAGCHNSGYFQIGFDPNQYSRPVVTTATGSIHKDFDVCFLGSKYGGGDVFSQSMRWHDAELRDQAVVQMREALGDRLGLFGRGWGGEERTVPLAQAHEVYWRSKAGLNVSLANDLECYTSDRLHRILGCGALLLAKSFPMMSTYGLEHGVNCLVWETPEQAVALAREWLLTDRDWKAVADAGATLAHANMTWDTRMLEVIPYLEAVRGAR